jgi:nucleotide-binding universal stress UspA family protein
MLFRNIMVPYDGSKYSLHAFKIALDIAQKYDSKLTVLTCLTKPEYRGVWYYDSRYIKAVLKKEEKAALENISKMIEPSKKKTDVPINFKIIPTVHIADQIVSFAKSHKIDLVVMGSHGRTGFGKVILGSVAHGVNQKVHCPVMVVK